MKRVIIKLKKQLMLEIEIAAVKWLKLNCETLVHIITKCKNTTAQNTACLKSHDKRQNCVTQSQLLWLEINFKS